MNNGFGIICEAIKTVFGNIGTGDKTSSTTTTAETINNTISYSITNSQITASGNSTQNFTINIR